jgi:ligand-binding sensor domain-containing protein
MKMYQSITIPFNLTLFAFLIFSVQSTAQSTTFKDTAFLQEYHKAYPISNETKKQEARSIAVDKQGNVWIATAVGILEKNKNETSWASPFAGADKGPSFAVVVDEEGTVWMGTWNGIYTFKNKTLQFLKGTEGPISVMCIASEGVYAAGPKGIWLCNENTVEKKNYPIARSLRKIISDNNNGVWIGSDVGLYHCTATGTKHFVDTSFLLSAYIKGLAISNGHTLWAGGLGGVVILNKEKKHRVLTPKNGCPSQYINCISKDADGTMWVGTDVGVVRFYKNGSHSLRFSNRWLIDDHVKDIAFDSDGTAWIATSNGVSAIMKRKMDLAAKQEYFYDVLMKRHIREPWIAGQCHLNFPGDVNSYQPEDDDNDGEFTGNYLAMESFRYAATKSADAREKAKKAFAFLKMQEEITGGDGYFARSIVPIDWTSRVHDNNLTYTEKELADELVKEPRFKPVETRWHPSKDGKWLWKGDASSDEWCGHMLGYFFYYELAADEAEKILIRNHVAKLVDHLITHNFNMIDIDGTPTRWAVWSPDLLNRDPEWLPDQKQNSMELLAFLKLAYYMTNDKKYQDHYLRLIKEEHYLDNMAKVTQQNPGWFIYYDLSLQVYLYPIFMQCEKDPKLLAFYRQHLEHWMERRRGDECPLFNFLYCYANKKREELNASINFLTDTPLDLVDWHIDHTKRADVLVVNKPVLDDVQIDQLPPASMRMVVRWDKNPWAAAGGDPSMEREPVFWLLPYWMGRYLKMIQ